MKKALIIFGSVLLVLLLLIVGAINFYFTNERLQGMVVPQLEQSLGRSVEVESMSVSLFSTLPDAALHIRNFSIPGERQDTLVAVRDFSVRIEVLPLWYNNINITSLTVDEPRFIYTVYKDGTTNLDFLMTPDTTTAPQPEQPPTAKDSATADTALTNIQIPALTIRNARFGYVDQSSRSEFLFNQLDADLSLEYAKQIATTLDLKIGKLVARMGEETYVDGLPLQLSQQSVLNLEDETLQLQQGKVSIRGLNLELEGQLSDWSADEGPHADLQFGTSSDNLDELLRLAPSSYQKQLSQYETRGSLDIKGNLEGYLAGEELPSYELALQVKNGYLKNPELADPVTDIQLDANVDPKAVTLNTLKATAGPNSISASGTIQDPLETDKSRIDLTTDASLDLSTIKNFYPLDPDTIALAGQLSANARLKGKLDPIEESIQNARIILKNGRIDYPTVIGPPLTDLQIEADVQGSNLVLKQLTATSQGNTLRANGRVSDYLSETPSFNMKADGKYDLGQTHHYYELKPYINELTGLVTINANLNGNNFDPLQWKINGGLQLEGVNVRGDSLPQPLQNLNGKLGVSPNSMELSQLSFQLGESDFDMKGRLTNYMEFLTPGEAGPVPRLTGTYSSKTLNIDEFIDWEEESDPETVYPIDLPRLNSTITANIDKLIVMGIPFTEVKGEVGTTPREMLMKDASAQLFDGTIRGVMTWTVRDPLDTHLDFKGSVDQVQADDFFREFQMFGGENDLQNYIEGAFSTTVDYQSDIDKHLMPEVPTTVSSGDFGMTKARLKGHPLQQKIATFLNSSELKNMAMDEWKATYTIKNSVLTLKNLRLTSGNIGAEMNGTQHLTEGTVDYDLKLYLPGRFKGAISSVITTKATEALTQKNGTIMLPLRVTGTMESPQVRPDKEVIEPIVKDYLKDKAGDVIKSLFK